MVPVRDSTQPNLHGCWVSLAVPTSTSNQPTWGDLHFRNHLPLKLAVELVREPRGVAEQRRHQPRPRAEHVRPIRAVVLDRHEPSTT
jgi:hypothetical protein